MNTKGILAFLAALLVGVFWSVYRHHGATIDAYLHTSHLHVQDWLLLMFGSLFVGGVAYSFLNRPDSFEWPSIVWLVIGGAMIYAEVADVPWLKEASCQIFNSRHHEAVWTEPCYQPK